MELYESIANWAGWPALVAILVLAGSYAYFVIQSRLELLKEKTEWLEQQLEVANEFRPDVLAQRLAERLRILTQELERLNEDHEASAQSIREKQTDLASVEGEIQNLTTELASAQEILDLVADRELVCPHCKAPMSIHEFYPDLIEYQGREIDVEHETIAYECGFEMRDGEIINMCPKVQSND